MMMSNSKQQNQYVKWFESINSKDIELVGGKNANLGEMYTNLKEKGGIDTYYAIIYITT